jgi:hypothetical protein
VILMANIIGSSAKQTSQANAEIVPSPPQDWINVVYTFKEFELLNDQDCTLIVDGGSEVFLRANQGFKYSSEHKPIKSVKIKEAGITFNWIAVY